MAFLLQTFWLGPMFDMDPQQTTCKLNSSNNNCALMLAMPWFKSLMWTYAVLQVEESLKEPRQNSIPFRHTVFTENVFATKWNRCMHLLLADCTHISCCKYLHITPPTIVSSWTLVISFGMYQPHRQGATKVCRMCVQPLHNPEPFCQSGF